MANYKISLSVGSDKVIFEASSPISESRNANYDGHSLIHLPTDLWAYRNTSSRHFSIAGKLVSRNPDEAMANSRYVDLIRSWVLPDFGSSGATPPIITLNGLYNTNITDVPCILKSYSIQFPDDVDWIYDAAVLNYGTGKNKTVGSSAMPIICNIQIDLEEAYSAKQISAKAWKINLSKGGSFVLGAGAEDPTSAGGGQAQEGATPSTTELSYIPGFGGIARDITGSPKASLIPTLGNGNMTKTYGVVNSSQISNTSKSSSDPFSVGYNPNSVVNLTTPATFAPPPTPSTATPALTNKAPTNTQ